MSSRSHPSLIEVATMAEPSPARKRFGKSVKTERFAVVQAKLADFWSKTLHLGAGLESTGLSTIGEAYLQRLEEDVEAKRRK